MASNAVTQGGWAANRIQATARLALGRSRWSLSTVREITVQRGRESSDAVALAGFQNRLKATRQAN